MKFDKTPLSLAVSALGIAMTLTATSANAYLYGTAHTFSIDDLQVTSMGRTFGEPGTYGASGILNYPWAICGTGITGTPSCPQGGAQPFTDKDGVELYPVTTKFGFNVVDFLGAQEKVANDGIFGEGFVGNIESAGAVIGVRVSNAATDTYKVKPSMGTWCQGLGGTSIKCSSEHYSVMEHVVSCHEVIPYFYADPMSGAQAYLSFPNPADGFFECDNAALDDNVVIIGGADAGQRLVDVTPGAQIEANDNTTVLHDIAASADYSVTLKDDGKPLYRWGSLIKRPNDIRFYARLPLPEEWKQPGADIPIQAAVLIVNHWITNNPNDQIRPEDLENEAASGRKPSYRIEANGDWTSTVPCYEGDGDFLPSDEGSTDPIPLPTGTVFKNTAFALDPAAEPGIDPADKPYAFSSDLQGGFTNAYYTTVNRNPFVWSYVDADATDVFEFIGHDWPLQPAELESMNLKLVSGPRWRLKPNKFGQDIPGLEIPKVECSAPPYGHDNILYETGEPVTTIINLLDWDEEAEGGPSPLASSKGWVDVTQNPFVTVAGEQTLVAQGEDPVKYTTNGLPMTDDFDVAFYIKGDRKPTSLYSVALMVLTGEEEE